MKKVKVQLSAFGSKSCVHTHIHKHTHTRTHARTHARTHITPLFYDFPVLFKPVTTFCPWQRSGAFLLIASVICTLVHSSSKGSGHAQQITLIRCLSHTRKTCPHQHVQVTVPSLLLSVQLAALSQCVYISFTRMFSRKSTV